MQIGESVVLMNRVKDVATFYALNRQLSRPGAFPNSRPSLGYVLFPTCPVFAKDGTRDGCHVIMSLVFHGKSQNLRFQQNYMLTE